MQFKKAVKDLYVIPICTRPKSTLLKVVKVHLMEINVRIGSTCMQTMRPQAEARLLGSHFISCNSVVPLTLQAKHMLLPPHLLMIKMPALRLYTI